MYKKTIGILFEKTIGDIIYTTSIVQSIRKNEPDAVIHVVTSDYGIEMMKEKNYYNIITKKFNPIFNYDIIYYPLRCLQAVPYWFAHGKHCRDLCAESIGLDLTVKNSDIYRPTADDVSSEIRDIADSRYIILAPRASADRRKEVQTETMSNFIKQLDLPVYQIGLSQDPQISGCNLDLLGNTSILETLYLISQAQTVISIDIFAAHAAAAYNTPYIGIYGQYSSEQVKPIDKADHCVHLNYGKTGEYNVDGCSNVKVEDLIKAYETLKGDINEHLC